MMKNIAFLPLLSIALLFSASASAEVIIEVGPEPACPYGYYDYEPYYCAPYGYYGPEWFVGERFVGAGPWFHGPAGFRGHVDNRFDPHHGYHGAFPERGDVPFHHFRGNEVRDGHREYRHP
jgi:hypothetical protein